MMKKAIFMAASFLVYGSMHAVDILFVQNKSDGSPIVIESESNRSQRVVVAPGQTVQNIHLPGSVILAYGKGGQQTKQYLNDERYLGISLGADGHLYRSLTSPN